LPDVQNVLRQTVRVPLTIADGISAITLAELIATEFRFERPPALLAFSAKFLALTEQESARRDERGNPAEYARSDQDVVAAYPAALADTRAEMGLLESRLAETTRRERERYAHEYLEAARAAGVEVGNVATSSSMSNQLALDPGTTVKVPIEAITVPAGRQVGDIAWLVESMRELGQLQPIVVTPDGELIAGMHRLRAALLLGWTEIQVIVLDLDGAKKQLAMLDENLVRRHLSALEYAEALRERQQLYLSLHPETEQYRLGGVAKAAKAASALSAVAESFSADTAARTGLSPRTIQEYTQVAGIPREVRDVLRSSGVNDKLKELLAVARLPVREQKNVAAVLSQGGAKNVKEAVGLVRAPSTTSPLPYAVTQGSRIRKQVGDIRRMSADIEATLKEWQATDPTGMAPFITQWTNIAASMSGACAVANQVEIPATACPCGGSRACSGCGGRGWKKDK
jgi:ParB-like chromosome segregation protein Spo0J